MTWEPRLGAAVLAAGASRRFGTPKQLLRLAGRTLLERAVAQAGAVSDDAVVVVLGSGADRLAPLVARTGVRVVCNDSWREGLAGSLRAAVEALPADCDGLLVLLVDQPAVPLARIAALAAAWRTSPDRVAASAYAATRGVPAILPRRLFPDVGRLRGDRGAGAIIAAEAAATVAVAVPEAALDVDVPEDWQRLLQECADAERR